MAPEPFFWISKNYEMQNYKNPFLKRKKKNCSKFDFNHQNSQSTVRCLVEVWKFTKLAVQSAFLAPDSKNCDTGSKYFTFSEV